MARFELVGQQGELAASLVHPAHRGGELRYQTPIVVTTAGFIPGAAPSEGTSRLEELAERLSAITGWSALSFSPSGIGRSKGKFSPKAWLMDWSSAISTARSIAGLDPVVALGFGVAGNILMQLPGAEANLGGVATVSMDLDLSDPSKIDELLRSMTLTAVGLKSGLDADGFLAEMSEMCAGDSGSPSCPWLVIQTLDQRDVTEEELRRALEGAFPPELHFFETDAESLRYDPRTLAVFMGWMERYF